MDITFTEEVRNRKFSYGGVYRIQYFGKTPNRRYNGVLIYGYDKTLDSNYIVKINECEYTHISIEREGT